ncbi:hypothetical protein ACJ7Z2_05195 [Mannheimia glucosida]|uniref:hypothetical protein n=1 Tax=Mannheimia glucosida TaxID=85401 RepID=UPI003906DE1F
MKYQYRHSYRITKYFNYNIDGFLADDGWSSFSDVPEKISLEEYLKIEQQYIYTILAVCKQLNIEYLRIKQLSDSNKKSGYRNRQKIKLSDLPIFLKGLLRENYWCKLTHFKCEFHFGYDYYLYCIAQADLFHFLNEQSELHIERFISPYA